VRIIAEVASQAGCRVIIGGRPAMSFPASFLPRDAEVVVVHGEMELAVQDLLAFEHWDAQTLCGCEGISFWDNGKICSTAARKEKIVLDRLPIPNRDLVNISEYIDVHTLLSSRGCVERCGFCPVHQFWGKWRRRSAERVVDEIEMLSKRYAAQKILFLDDHAMVDVQRLREISREIIRRGIRVALGCLGTPRSADGETLLLMREAGFSWIHYGAEFGSDRVLQLLRKRSSVELIRRAIELTQAAGIRVRTSWIFDSPGATLEELDATIELILETEPEEIRAHFLSLRAQAPFFEELQVAGTAIPSQYIHAQGPQQRGYPLEISAGIFEQRMQALTRELEFRGYRSIREPAEWQRLSAAELADPSLKFISFCPGRYGLGWAPFQENQLAA
jgi:anaerobic magnesium-protoporphyrin IX monomethyl ester cyclase